ncbi:hypothetical protein [Trabulsiella odontotermitis]|uniref:Uncharacterized protein n=1 Tax=Trabulsiella odontotermitis TaxID=379893 RepID=A0A0L0GZJ1_9ENTR|nr:hypothetical protein [Trabulsiella odontotermitis]KNC94159.1 hypothetical protein GM31_15950 [Trabulsiella odontotermitis]
MAKTVKNTGAQVVPVLSEEEEKALTMAGTEPDGDLLSVDEEDVEATDEGDHIPEGDDFNDDDDGGEDTDDTDDEDGLLVVVCKGHTLYHDGKKYPQSHRLRMRAEDASRLLKRGVVVKFDDLLKKVSGHAG